MASDRSVRIAVVDLDLIAEFCRHSCFVVSWNEADGRGVVVVIGGYREGECSCLASSQYEKDVICLGLVVGIGIFHCRHLFVAHGAFVVFIVAAGDVLVDTFLVREPELMLGNA